MGTQVLLGTFMIMLTVVIHIGGLVGLSVALTHVGPKFDRVPQAMKAIGLLVPSVLFVLLLHVLEAWLWAALLLYVGEFSSVESALYFSTVTSTTLGYGDVTLSETWRLLGAFEAMGGLILFAASTAFLLADTRSVLDDAFEKVDPSGTRRKRSEGVS